MKVKWNDKASSFTKFSPSSLPGNKLHIQGSSFKPLKCCFLKLDLFPLPGFCLESYMQMCFMHTHTYTCSSEGHIAISQRNGSTPLANRVGSKLIHIDSINHLIKCIYVVLLSNIAAPHYF